VKFAGKARFCQRVGTFGSDASTYVSAELQRNPLPSRGDGIGWSG